MLVHRTSIKAKNMSRSNCLLIKTVDNRRFFTKIDHFPQLIEFSKIVGAQISVVKPVDDPISVVSLEQLAKVFCDSMYTQGDVKYEVIEDKVIPPQTPSTQEQGVRGRVLSQAKEVRKYISDSFLQGNVVSIWELKNKYKGLGMSCLRNHLCVVRNELTALGHKVDKHGTGCYKITT